MKKLVLLLCSMAAIIAAPAAHSAPLQSYQSTQTVSSVGYTVSSTATGATVAASSHAVGTSMGGLLTFSNAAGLPGGSGTARSLVLTLSDGIMPTLDVIVFNAQPSSSTVTDGSAVSIAAADLPKVIGVFQPTSAVSLGTASLLQDQVNSLTFGSLGAGSTLYAVAVVRGSAVTPALNDLAAQLTVYQDRTP